MSAPIHRWTCGPLDTEVERSLARLARVPGAVRVAVMPDVHLAHDVCIGTVLATSDRIVPAAVGGDIGCGMAALAFDAAADVLDDAAVAARVLLGIERAVPVVKHPRRAPLPDHLDSGALSHPALRRAAERDGAVQFGTLGRGNHFVELQRDPEGRLWMMAHSGSRGMGVAIRDHHLRGVAAPPGGLAVLDAGSDAGRSYLADHDWALSYADANRRRLVERVAEVLSTLVRAAPVAGSLVTCHHNHVRREEHFGATSYVHRKGAIPAADGEPGIVPGSMGTASVHTLGRGHRDALRSSSHGAGRTMSRSEARRRVTQRAFRDAVGHVWYDRARERRLVDESPQAYRDLDAVLRAQRELTRVVRRLEPVLSFKGV